MSELFLTVLNHAIAAGWLVPVIVVLRLLLRRAPRTVHCALWGLVGLRLVWPFRLESALSLLPSAETVPPEILYDPMPQIHTGVSSFNAVVNPYLTEYMVPHPGNSVNPLQVYTAIAAYVWLLGVAVMLLCALVSFLRLRRAVAGAVVLEEGVLCSGAINTPFILGVFRPRIYLPASMEEARRAYVLAHERAHLQRRDHWWKPLGWLLLCCFWFHPLLWLAWVLLGRDMEFSCDEKVIRTMDTAERKAYSHALLSCSAPHRSFSACPLAFGEVGVKQRIRAVLDYRKPALWLLVLSTAALVVLALCFLTDPLTPEMDDPTLPAVSWTYSPATSVTWGGAFPFDFAALEYTHIEATCDAGELWDLSPTDHIGTDNTITLEKELSLWWSPFEGSFTNLPKEATVTFTVYKGLLPLYEGTIYLTRTGQKDLLTTYEARLGGELRLLRDRSLPGARVVTEAMYHQATDPATVIFSGTDLDHDGRTENIHLHSHANGQEYELLVVEDGSLLWSTNAHTSHPGWTTYALVERDGQDYLLEYTPYMIMGYGSYNYSLFTLENNGSPYVEQSSAYFVWPTETTPEMSDFAAGAEALLEEATVLLSTEGGTAVIGPVPATEVAAIWPVTFDPEAKGR